MTYRSLNSICQAREEARYVSRTWSNVKDPVQKDVPNKIVDDWTSDLVKKYGSIDAYNEYYAQNERRKEANIPNLIAFANALNELPERRRCAPLWGKFPNDHAKIRELMDADPSRFNAKVIYELDNFEELYK